MTTTTPDLAADIAAVECFAWHQRRMILDMALAAGADSSHLGGGLSLVDLTATLFARVLRLDPRDPCWPGRDRFILSKGHGVLAYYAALAQVGYLDASELAGFEADGSSLLGHPIMRRDKGVEFSTGSLGMGLSLGVGVALAARRRQQQHRVYVVVGDGECNEGAIWEAAMAAAAKRLTNLVCIVDRNGFQQTGSNEEIMPVGDVVAKLASFGWEASEVDGHDVGALLVALRRPPDPTRPRALVARTVKGRGLSFAENDNSWHHRVLTQALFEQGVAELEAAREASSWS